MANEKKLVEAITSMDEDFAQWYTDVVKKAELTDYSSVRGCMILRPAGYAIWENIQKELDRRFKEIGVENVYMPLFIPESLLQKEKDHVEGFAPEVAWVTQGGLDPLPERLCVHQRLCSVICIRISFIHIEIFQRFITSGVQLFVGKRQPDLSFVRWNSYGRKVIRHMLQQKKQRKEPSRC